MNYLNKEKVEVSPYFPEQTKFMCVFVFHILETDKSQNV
jgi:hypothetical protein